MSGFRFSTLIEACDAESHDRNLIAQSSPLAYSHGGGEYLNSIKT